MILGSILVALGGTLAFVAVLCRFGFYAQSRIIKFGWKYYLCILMSFLGTILAAIGFYLLVTQTPINAKQDYSQILGVLSLLAAGIITGFFTFSYVNVSDDEVILPTCISCCFVVLFYLVFLAISYYVGRSSATHNIENVEGVVPGIMWLLLVANMIYDFLDYRKNEPAKP